MGTESISTRLSLGMANDCSSYRMPGSISSSPRPGPSATGSSSSATSAPDGLFPTPFGGGSGWGLSLLAGRDLDRPRGAGRGHANCRYRRRDHAFFWLHAGGSQDLVLVQGVLLQERLGQTVQPPSVFLEQAHRLLVALVHDPAHLLIEHLRGLLA